MHDQGLSYVSEIIRIELTSHFGIAKSARKYYGDLQLLPIPTHCRKGTSYDSILVIIGQFTKMIYYKPAQMTDAPRLVEVFIDLIVRYGLP